MEEPLNVHQRQLAAAPERLGELLERAALDHETDEVRRATWRRIADAAAKVAACAAILGGEGQEPDRLD